MIMINKIHLLAILISLLGFTSCGEQTKNMKSETSKNNPLLCDLEKGLCETPSKKSKDSSVKIVDSAKEKIKIVYFTDPICSSCWGIEPQLRKLKLEYGQHIEMEYRMGGLLPDWSYNSGGISQPSDVAKHWDEVSLHYDMPIDGDVWLEDPLDSSYPPSIAFKAAQLQDAEKAYWFMREIREMVFLQKINIAKWEHLAIAAKKVGLHVDQLKTDFEGKAKTLFEEDLIMAKEFGVRGFPTIFVIDRVGNKEIVYGSKAYAFYETAILKIEPTIVKSEYNKNWETLFSKYHTLTAKEFSVLSGVPRIDCDKLLNELVANGRLDKKTTKNGAIWIQKSTLH